MVVMAGSIGGHTEDNTFTTINITMATKRYATHTIVSCKYSTQFFCMLASGKQGRGLMRGIGIFLGDDHYRSTIAT